MRALVLNGTLKKSPQESNTGALARFVAGELEQRGVDVFVVRLVDHDIQPGVVSELVAPGDHWPTIHEQILAAQILVLATPTWLGQPSSVIKRALERMNGLLSETDDAGVPVAFNKVAGFIVTGNEDGAHHCVSEMAGAAIDLGLTVPGQAWTYWNKGPGPGDEEYLTTDDREWTHDTGRTMAHVLVAHAHALSSQPVSAPPG